MRKKTLILILICAVLLCLSACDSEITDIVAKDENVSVSIGSSINVSDLIEVTGKGNYDFLIEPAGIVTINGNKLVATEEGTCVVTFYSGDIRCMVRVTVVNGKRISVGISDETLTYDGNVHTLKVSGTYPASSEVILRHNGEIFTGATDPGVYELELEVLPPEGYFVDYTCQNAVLTIDKIYHDLSSIRFSSLNHVYDGTEKALTISGALPSGVTVRYENNVATDAGVYLAKAYFTVDERYYHSIDPMGAKLTILKCDLSQQIKISNVLTTYDGQEHFPSWILPVGVNATYYVYNPATYGYIPKADYYSLYSAKRPFVNSGTYRIKTVFTLDETLQKNYYVDNEAESTVTISKADFVNEMTFTASIFDYDGTAKTIGLGEDYDVRLTGAMPTGINGEFATGTTVEFYYGTIHGQTLSFTNAGNYLVRARFSQPDGYSVNYNDLEEMVCSVVIDKVTYPTNFTFTPVEISGEVDFSTPKVFDGSTHYFALRFPSDEDKEAITDVIRIKYYYIKDHGNKTYVNDDKVGVLDAGNYTIGYQLEFIDITMKNNYNLPPDGFFNTSITKVVYNMKDVTFEDMTVVYDGEAHTPTLTGVPEGVSVAFSNAEKINAGTYTVTANFSDAGMTSDNYTLKGNDGELTAISAVLTINKADYAKSAVPAFYTESREYAPNTKLSDVPILLGGVVAHNVEWLNGNDKPVCNVSTYDVVYNDDPTNYNGYRYKLPLTVTPLTLMADQFAVEDQFVSYTGTKARPKITYDGGAISGVSLAYNCETEAIDYGAHVLTEVTLVLDDEINYAFDGSVDFGSRTIYIYNGSLYRYSGLILQRYIGGELEVSVPYGTTNIVNGAFENCYVTQLTLPETVTSMSVNALGGMPYIRELTLPYIGTAKGSGTFAQVFGVSGIPATLVKVTVTDITTLPDNAFANASNLTDISFTHTITSVGQYAFDGCSSLTTLDLSGATHIGSYALHGCFGLLSLCVPFMGEEGQTSTISHLVGTNVGTNEYINYALALLDLRSGTFTSLPSEAFKGMVSIKTLYLPATLSSVSNGAFSGLYADVALNENFSSVTAGAFDGYKGSAVSLPSTITRIEEYAFRDATNISSLTLPVSLNYIGRYAFRNVRGTITFAGAAITRLEEYAFAGFAGGNVALPSSVTSLGDGAFAESKVVDVIISSSVVLDGEGIFKGCTSLRYLSLDAEEIPYQTCDGCTALERLTLSSTVTIESRAFRNCSSLPSVNFPNTVTSIGSHAFDGCTSISIMTFASSAPIFGSCALPTTQALSVYVPSGKEEEYRGALIVNENDYLNVTIAEY